MPRASGKGRTFAPEIVSADEARRLLAACSRGATGARNRALLVLLYRAGLRVGEALKLKPEHVDPEAGTVRVRNGKGVQPISRRAHIAAGGAPDAPRSARKRTHAPRTVAVDPAAAELLGAWLRKRAALGIAASAPYVCTLDGRPVLPSYVRSLCKRLAQRAGIDPARVHPHSLRHTFAAELAREGTAVNVIQAALGHSSLATTSLYLAHVAPDELVNALRARVWSPSAPR